MASKFKRRYILAEGYPWALGSGPLYNDICMREGPVSGRSVPINFPEELWKKNLPKYRLVLELIKK